MFVLIPEFSVRPIKLIFKITLVINNNSRWFAGESLGLIWTWTTDWELTEQQWRVEEHSTICLQIWQIELVDFVTEKY